MTGTGKSSVSNCILNKEKFKVSADVDSQTSETRGALGSWFDNNKDPVIVIDTPGFGDSKNRDTQHIARMVFSLKQVGYVNTFLIVLNSQQPRFDEEL